MALTLNQLTWQKEDMPTSAVVLGLQTFLMPHSVCVDSRNITKRLPKTLIPQVSTVLFLIVYIIESTRLHDEELRPGEYICMSPISFASVGRTAPAISETNRGEHKTALRLSRLQVSSNHGGDAWTVPWRIRNSCGQAPCRSNCTTNFITHASRKLNVNIRTC